MSSSLRSLTCGVLLACSTTDEAASRVHEATDPWGARARVEVGAVDPAAGRGAEVFSSCASCHLADASGRPDGSVPRLAGQREAVLVDKLQRLRDGRVHLPVMEAFARSLSPAEIADLAAFLSGLEGLGGTHAASAQARPCLACHGAAADAVGGPLAPRLCGQHAAYLERRARALGAGDRADQPFVPAMAATLAALSDGALAEVAAGLAAGGCVVEEADP